MFISLMSNLSRVVAYLTFGRRRGFKTCRFSFKLAKTISVLSIEKPISHQHRILPLQYNLNLFRQSTKRNIENITKAYARVNSVKIILSITPSNELSTFDKIQ
jgi:hypothetical protein